MRAEKGKFPLIVEVCAGVLNAFPFLPTPVCANSAEFDSQPASAETRPINFHRFAWPITANIFTGVPVQFSAREHTRDIHDNEAQKHKQQENTSTIQPRNKGEKYNGDGYNDNI